MSNKTLRYTTLALAAAHAAFGQSYTISTIAGGVPPDNILATSAGLGVVEGVAVDSAHNVFLLSNYTVFRLAAATGSLSRIAGNGASGFSGDNGPAISAQIDGFYNGKYGNGLAVDSTGTLYIAGPARVRKIQGGVITTVAGNGTMGFSGDNGPATSAQLGVLGGIAADSAGNLYIADNLYHRIRMVHNGTITTVAGDGTYGSGGDNGLATSAQLDATGVAVDSAGNLYVADGGGNRIREVSNGVITTIAGNGTYGFTGDNSSATSAQLRAPYDIAVGSNGDVYFADEGTRIRKVSNGVITTVAGSGTYGFSGDNGPAISAQMGRSQRRGRGLRRQLLYCRHQPRAPDLERGDCHGGGKFGR